MKTLKLFLAITFLLTSSVLMAQSYTADIEKSTVKWEGKKIGGAHDGHIKLKSGSLSIENNKITSGSFVMDMNSMTNDDIEDEEYKGKLIGHLKSDDFFGTETYPTSKLVIKESTAFKDNKAKVKADLTIKSTTLPIEFEVTKKGDSFITQLTINRAKYDIRYGSKSFFSNLGDKVIYDDFTLDITLVVK